MKEYLNRIDNAATIEALRGIVAEAECDTTLSDREFYHIRQTAITHGLRLV
jgi:hypothetical protein